MFAFKSASSNIQLDSLMEVTCLYIPLEYFLKFLIKHPHSEMLFVMDNTHILRSKVDQNIILLISMCLK